MAQLTYMSLVPPQGGVSHAKSAKISFYVNFSGSLWLSTEKTFWLEFILAKVGKHSCAPCGCKTLNFRIFPFSMSHMLYFPFSEFSLKKLRNYLLGP